MMSDHQKITENFSRKKPVYKIPGEPLEEAKKQTVRRLHDPANTSRPKYRPFEKRPESYYKFAETLMPNDKNIDFSRIDYEITEEDIKWLSS